MLCPAMTTTPVRIDGPSFWETVPLIGTGESETTPYAGALTVMKLSATASQGQPGERVRLDEMRPPLAGTLWVCGETLGLQSTGELKSILLTTAVVRKG